MPPKRIKWKHLAGSQLPANTKIVTMQSRFGNPFKITGAITREKAVSLYRQAVLSGELRTGKDGRYHITVDYVREHLKGFDLACDCALDMPCHADVLLEVANGAQVTGGAI